MNVKKFIFMSIMTLTFFFANILTASASTLLLKIGTNDSAVLQLKLDLEEAGYKVSDNPNEFYGNITAQKVQEFQQAHGLVSDGIAGSNTLQKLAEVIKKSTAPSIVVLENGVNDPSVIQLKLDLEKAGFKVSDNPTDFYGPLTAQRVMEFQKENGLNITGVADDQTLKRLQTILSGENDSGGDKSDSPILKIGTYHQSVIQLKIDLEKAGFKVSDNPNDYYGPITAEKVSKFQKVYGLTADGIAGTNTLKKLQEVLLLEVLQIGVYHEDVIKLKTNLKKAGFKVSDNPNNYYGPITAVKVEEFQMAFGLKATGIADKQTLDAIQQAISEKILQVGVHHSSVIQLKLDLEKAGFKVSDNPNDYYGPITAVKVKEFQKTYGLPPDGIAGEKTLKKLAEVLTIPSVLKIGDHHSAVITLKINLEKAGFKVSNTPNDFYGSTTKKKVQEFQRSYGLMDDGIAGNETFNMLKKVVNAGKAPTVLKEGMHHPVVIQLKVKLESIGFKISNNPNDYYGSITTAKVKEFQKSYGLTADGIAGSNTFKKLNNLFANTSKTKPLSGKKIVIDAGHGGDDPGAVSKGLKESVFVLDIAKQLKSSLENDGATVQMTRSTDIYLTLSQRYTIANNSDADAFISIHNNAGGGYGTETYWNSKYSSTKSKQLATNIQKELVSKVNLRDRGVKQGNFSVIKYTKIPSSLVEVAFIDNANERSLLNTSKFRKSAAEGIYNGIREYFN
ncbi:peptidoglycan-binding protein [Metabacillus halosaccharovorans]|uniref:peptidoglycan-binding protein n=1 Tax=Metabacillus halosaccharovorans TaxID=930124 RepID=UPI00203C704B|nr:peptidoglycan-binding protein [Metabacillus halosaccharovorans]MCM3443782.1 peptidoglycan-binding protein [Metabacillus halosaccharovorans]